MDPILEMDRETREALKNIARIGTVMDVDDQRLRARVSFQDAGVNSAWLTVLKRGMVLHAREQSFVLKPWMPEIGAPVLCVYLPYPDSPGYVVGEIGAPDAVL